MAGKRKERRGGVRANAGRPPHVPTDIQRAQVRSLIVGGWTQARVAEALKISVMTLRKHYEVELDGAKAQADAMVSRSLLMMAVGGPQQDFRQAVPSAAIFYAKTRMGWNERQQIEHVGAVGSYDLTKVSDDDLKRLETILAGAIAGSVAGNSGGDPD